MKRLEKRKKHINNKNTGKKTKRLGRKEKNKFQNFEAIFT